MKYRSALCMLVITGSFTVAGCSDWFGPETANIQSITVDSSAGPIFRTIEVQLDNEAGAEVTYSAPGLETLRVVSEAKSRNHRIFLPRLRAGRVYQFEVRALSEAGRDTIASFTTGALPADLAQLRFTPVRGVSTMPLYLIEVMITNNGFNGAFIIDAAGDVVWYWRSADWINGAEKRQNGNFVFLEEIAGLVELTPDLSVQARLTNGQGKPFGQIHHDAIVTPQNTVYFLAREPRVIRDTTVVGEALWEWSPERGTVEKKWDSFQFMNWDTERSPASAANNWLHANSLHIGPRGNVVISFRNLNQIISIKPDFSGLEWRLGGPGSTLAVAEADRFLGQHSAREVAPNRVLVFDNGFGRSSTETWSRVTEFAINPATGSAQKVWEFRPSPDNDALRVGAVNRLPNGNTTAAFGWGQGSPIVIYELRPDASVGFELRASEMMNRMYRARPLSTVGGEEVVF